MIDTTEPNLEDDPVMQAIRDGKTKIELKNRPLVHVMEDPTTRRFINVKDALRKALVFFSKRYPEPTKENTSGAITHALLDIFDKFREYNRPPAEFQKLKPARPDLFDAIFRIVPSETEHDGFYLDRIQVMLEMVIQKVLDGEWPARNIDRPWPKYWAEPRPYGGEHSIIYKLAKHGEEIKKILEES